MKTVKNILTQIGTFIVIVIFVVLAMIISLFQGFKYLYDYGHNKI